MSSAANTIPPSTEREKNEGNSTTRPNPVALEVPVSVTGARASSEGSRDLFTEEAQTVLVFRDGAVIRLAAPVSAGQLLFLTNKTSKVEVVCQVLRKRNMGTPLNYVELQFTEERPDYWGVAFPTGQKIGAEFHAAEHVEAEKTTERDAGTAVAPHSSEDVEQLKKEVEALRQQLKEFEAKKTAAREGGSGQSAGQDVPAAGQAGTKTVVPEPTASVAATHGSAGAPAAGVFAKGKEELAPVNDPSPETPKGTLHKDSSAQSSPQSSGHPGQALPASGQAGANKPASEAPLMPGAATKKEAGRAVVGMTLPTRPSEKKGKTEEAKDASEDLLPKPSLDFSKMPAMGLATQTALELLRRRRTEAGKKVLGVGLAVLLAVLGLSVWHGKMWTYLRPGKKATAAMAPARVAKPSAGAAKTGGAGPGAGNSGSAAGKNAAANGGAATNEEKSASEGLAAENSEDERDRNASEAKTGKAEAAASKKAVGAKGKNKGEAGEAAPAEANAAEVEGSDTAAVPAKLVRAANPVYPPDAMRNYITGDVKAEVVVAADGHVGEVKVLSGPKPLRDAAVEALKQYQYEPARQGGKAVASKVTVTVKFWFNP